MKIILGKAKGSIKEFFSKSKKLIQPPKELPNIVTHQPRPPMPPSGFAPKEHLMIKTELPQNPLLATAQLKSFTLPKLELPKPQEPLPAVKYQQEEELMNFEKAISNITIDVMENKKEEEQPQPRKEPQEKEEEYYKPAGLGEGYFSEIRHFIRNKDTNEIIEDIITKDFLTSMKDYHDTKAKGKPYYLHSEDLKLKLERKMNELMRLEERWHGLKQELESKENEKKHTEQSIDAQSQELKDLFLQIKTNQLLEKEASKESHFKLRNGQELKNLNDLRKALSYLKDEEFYHHLTPERNDFANWTREALQNPALAEKMKNAKTRQEFEEVLKNPL